MRPGHLLLGVLRADSDLVTQAVEHSGTDLAGLSAAVLAGLSAA